MIKRETAQPSEHKMKLFLNVTVYAYYIIIILTQKSISDFGETKRETLYTFEIIFIQHAGSQSNQLQMLLITLTKI